MAWQQFPNGKLENVFLGAVNTFASTAEAKPRWSR